MGCPALQLGVWVDFYLHRKMQVIGLLVDPSLC
jgi:hypothetical protein